jgi:hypothetical protein
MGRICLLDWTYMPVRYRNNFVVLSHPSFLYVIAFALCLFSLVSIELYVLSSLPSLSATLHRPTLASPPSPSSNIFCLKSTLLCQCLQPRFAILPNTLHSYYPHRHVFGLVLSRRLFLASSTSHLLGLLLSCFLYCIGVRSHLACSHHSIVMLVTFAQKNQLQGYPCVYLCTGMG